MAIHWADSAGRQGTGDGSSSANACALDDFITNDAILASPVAAGDECRVKAGARITFDGSAGAYAVSAVAGTVTSPIRVEGYATTFGDGGVVEIEDTNSGATNNCLDINHDYWQFGHFKIINPRDGINFSNTCNGALLWDIEIVNPVSDGIDMGAATGDVATLYRVRVSGGGTGIRMARRDCRLIQCSAIGVSGVGFDVGNAAYGAFLQGCLAHGCGSHGFDVMGELAMQACVSDGNLNGLNIADSDQASLVVDSLFTNNTTYGITGVSGSMLRTINCYGRGNNTDVDGNVSLASLTALTTDPYTDRAGDDFSINNTAGGGATLRSVSAALSAFTAVHPFNWLTDGAGGVSSGPSLAGIRRLGARLGAS